MLLAFSGQSDMGKGIIMTTHVRALAKRLLPALAVILLIALPAACSQGGGRLDGSSNEAFQKSVKEIKESLSGDKRAQFEDAMKFFIMRESFKQVFGGGGKDENKLWESLRQQLGGLTADEVIAKAKAIREEAARQDKGGDDGTADESGGDDSGG